MAIALTDSARVREGYAGYVGRSLFAVLAIHLLLFSFAPPFHFKPYELPVGDGPIEVLPPDDIELPPPPRDVPAPAVDIRPADDGEPVEDVIIPPNFFPDFGAGPVSRVDEPERSGVFVAFDEKPVLLVAAPPVYPELARQAGIEGKVVVKVLVDTDGTVVSASVIESDVTPAMEKAAIRAALKFVFMPAVQGSQRVRAYMAVPVAFRLH